MSIDHVAMQHSKEVPFWKGMTDMTSLPSLAAGLSLKGRSAVITGSTSGIGLAIAEGLAMAGANVMLNGFGKADEIEATRARLAATFGVTCAYSAADLSTSDGSAGLVPAAEAAFGAVDILVNNAGIQHVSPIESFPPEKWDAILAINLSSAFHTIRTAVPGMKARNWGRIINIASAHGLVASPFKSAYVAAKHGIIGLTKTVGLELAETPITCNAICPGYVKTPLVDAQIKDQAKVHNMAEDQVVRDVILAAQPNKRFVGTDELAGLVLFLCSDLGASFTGSALPIEGGWTAR
jgi:3-hydroxybutyrate dehydrogenase